MKGSKIKPVKELQPSVSASCCSRDRHANSQVDIKSKAITNYLRSLIYYRVEGRGVHRPCLYSQGVDNESYPET